MTAKTIADIRARFDRIRREQRAFNRRFKNDPEFRAQVKAKAVERILSDLRVLGCIPAEDKL